MSLFLKVDRETAPFSFKGSGNLKGNQHSKRGAVHEDDVVPPGSPDMMELGLLGLVARRSREGF